MFELGAQVFHPLVVCLALLRILRPRLPTLETILSTFLIITGQILCLLLLKNDIGLVRVDLVFLYHTQYLFLFVASLIAEEGTQARLIRVLLKQCFNVHGLLREGQGGVYVVPPVLRHPLTSERLQNSVLSMTLVCSILRHGVMVEV